MTMSFRKGDRVEVRLPDGTTARGTVQQSRDGGANAVVALDDRRRVSVRQSQLTATGEESRAWTPERVARLADRDLRNFSDRRSTPAALRRLVDAELQRRAS